MIRAQDETYRDAKTVHSKFMRHQAFEAELQSNKERLEQLQEVNFKKIQFGKLRNADDFSEQIFISLSLGRRPINGRKTRIYANDRSANRRIDGAVG